jgi:hypothetical protein
MQQKTSIDQLLLITLTAIVFLLAAVGLYLLQDPSAPLPWTAAAPITTNTLPVLIDPTVLTYPTQTPPYHLTYTPFVTHQKTETPQLTTSLSTGSTARATASLTSPPIATHAYAAARNPVAYFYHHTNSDCHNHSHLTAWGIQHQWTGGSKRYAHGGGDCSV